MKMDSARAMENLLDEDYELASGFNTHRPQPVRRRTARIPVRRPDGRPTVEDAPRTDDDGTTGLGDGRRVPRTMRGSRPTAGVDECNSAIGVVLAIAGLPVDAALVVVPAQQIVRPRRRICIPGHRVIQAAQVSLLEQALDALSSSAAARGGLCLAADGGGQPARLSRAPFWQHPRRSSTLARLAVGANRSRCLNRLSDTPVHDRARVHPVPRRKCFWQRGASLRLAVTAPAPPGARRPVRLRCARKVRRRPGRCAARPHHQVPRCMVNATRHDRLEPAERAQKLTRSPSPINRIRVRPTTPAPTRDPPAMQAQMIPRTLYWPHQLDDFVGRLRAARGERAHRRSGRVASPGRPRYLARGPRFRRESRRAGGPGNLVRYLPRHQGLDSDRDGVELQPSGCRPRVVGPLRVVPTLSAAYSTPQFFSS